eukprot:s111_g10.t2
MPQTSQFAGRMLATARWAGCGFDGRRGRRCLRWATSATNQQKEDWQKESDFARKLRRLPARELCEAVQPRLNDLDFVSMLTAFQRLSKLGIKNPEEEELAVKLIQGLRRYLGSHVARERNRSRRFPWLSQGAWAAAKVLSGPSSKTLQTDAMKLLEEVSQASAQALQRRKPFEARDAANLLWALAAARVSAPVEAFDALLVMKTEAFAPQDIANLIWALTRLENGDCDSRLGILEKLCGLAQKQIWHLEPQGLAAVLSALAAARESLTLGPGVATTVATLLRAAAKRLEEELSRKDSSSWRSSELVQLFWAFSVLQLDVVYYEHLPAKGLQNSWTDLPPRDLSLLAWSFANSNSESLAMEVGKIAAAGLPKLRDFDHQGISNLVWALGAVSLADREVFSRVGTLVSAGDFTARQVTNISWGYATAAFLHHDLFKKAKRLAERSFDAFRVDEQVSLLWSFAIVSLPSDTLCSSPCLKVAGSEMSAREAANLCWTLAVLGQHREDVLVESAKLLEAKGSQDLELHLAQWHYAFMAFKLEGGNIPGDLQTFALRAAAAAKNRAVAKLGRTEASSKLHGEVSAKVRRLCPREPIRAGCLGQVAGFQIVLRDGMRCFCQDMAYRKHAAAKDRQFGKYALNTSHLRMLMTALSVFLTARGQKVWILDLEGVPLGKQLSSLLAPLAATLTEAGARHLQWLNLSGCGIADRGLALLLPSLGNSGKVLLPELEAILLAENKLSDVQLVIHLLRSRTWLCMNGKATSLRLLDLSRNPRLVTDVTERMTNLGTRFRGDTLMLSISRFLAEGLPLQVLRLKDLKLRNDDILPLLKLLGAEADGFAMGANNEGPACQTCLEEVDLTGNFCSAELQAEVVDVINLLKQLRSQPELCWRLRRSSRWPLERPQRLCPGSRSQPESDAHVESEADIDDLKREAVSECQVDTDLPLASLEDLKDDARYCERTRRAVRESGVDAEEIILGSPPPASLLIRQMILDDLQHLHDMDGSLIPASPNLLAEQVQVEETDVEVLEGGRIDPCFEGLPLRKERANSANAESCEGRISSEFEMQRDMQRGAMAKIPWKDEFFNAKINEMCRGFLEPKESTNPDAESAF